MTINQYFEPPDIQAVFHAGKECDPHLDEPLDAEA